MTANRSQRINFWQIESRVRVEALLSRIKIHSNFGFIFSANFNSRGKRERKKNLILNTKFVTVLTPTEQLLTIEEMVLFCNSFQNWCFHLKWWKFFSSLDFNLKILTIRKVIQKRAEEWLWNSIEGLTTLCLALLSIRTHKWLIAVKKKFLLNKNALRFA